jgi:hypothetical protein
MVWGNTGYSGCLVIPGGSAMRTDEELVVLFEKFDEDTETKSRGLRALIAFDQLVNAVFWNGSQGETVSSHISRRKTAGTATWFDRKVCCALSKLECNHCKNSLGE